MPPTVTRGSVEDMLAIEEMCELVNMRKIPAEVLRILAEGPLNLKVLMNAKSMAHYCVALQELGIRFYKKSYYSTEVER